MLKEPNIVLSPKVADDVRQTTCYMCACRCGIDVFLRDGRVRYIQGNQKHPVNKGVLCAKGSAGMLQCNSPARLTNPLLRTGARGEGKFKAISWEEALDLALEWLRKTRKHDPRRLAFFTGRDQSQSLTGWWAQQYGTPNHAAHGGFCSVNMAAAGIYTLGSSFWEFGQPDWDRAKLLLMFGVAEDHDSNPIKLGLSQLRSRDAQIVSVNPVRTGYSAIANTWIGITPGTDGLLVLSLVRELLQAGKIDIEALRYRTNAAWLVQDDDGLFLRDQEGLPMVIDSETGQAVPDASCTIPMLSGQVTHPGGGTARPVFSLLAEQYLDEQYAPEQVADITGVSAATIRGLAADLARVAFDEAYELKNSWTDWRGNHHTCVMARPVAVHAMRGISAHANGFQTCRAIHLLQMILGVVDCPGGMRFKPPYPKPVEAHPRPARYVGPNQPLAGPPLGYPLGPEDLLVDENGEAERLDKAFSWEAPLAAHGMLQMAIPNAAAHDPYPIDVMFLYMANMAWNSSMNTPGAMEALSEKDSEENYRIPHLIVSDAFASEMVSYADLVLPDTTYLERHDCISLLDRPIGEPDLAGDAIRYPVINIDRDVRPFQDVLIELGARLELPGFVDADGAPKWCSYAEYIQTHERRLGVGPLAGWRGKTGETEGRGAVNSEQIERYIDAGGFWTSPVPETARYYKHINADYQKWAVSMGFYDAPQPYVLQIYSEPLRRFQRAAEGYGSLQPPERLRSQIAEAFAPLPFWAPPQAQSKPDFPLHAITQRPMAMYHSWGSHNPWLRQLHAHNMLYVPSKICSEIDLKDGDWAWLESPHARIRVQVRKMEAVNNQTVWTWNAIGKRRGAWRLDANAPEVTQGFLLNHLISELLPERKDGYRWANADPVTGQAAWYDLRVRLRKADEGEIGSWPDFLQQEDPPGMKPTATMLRYGLEWVQ